MPRIFDNIDQSPLTAMSHGPGLEFIRVELHSNACPACLRRAVGSGGGKHVHAAGNLGLLSSHVVGVLASREVDPAGLQRAARAFRDLIAADVCIIGGWHSPLEAAVLEAPETAGAKLGMLLATGSDRAVLPDRVVERVHSGAGFVLTQCGRAVNRITRAVALRRNELVVALSDALLVPLAGSGSATLGAAKRAIAAGKPVLTIDLRLNGELLRAGARVFTRTVLVDALAKSPTNRA